MKTQAAFKSQRGITLLMGMIMLILITLMVTSAFILSNTNLKAVGNMQVREEAIAAANFAIEEIFSSEFTGAPSSEILDIDLDNDGKPDYVVSVSKPICVAMAMDNEGAKSSISLPNITKPSWNTIWDVEATVNDLKTGATATINAGVRVLLTLTYQEVQAKCV
jgi:hypothetical protein